MSRHLSRLSAPKNWPIQKKGIKFVIKPRPGPHALKKCIPLNLVLKELVKTANTSKEVTRILNTKNVLIDNIRRKDPAFPLGFMDILTISETKQSFRIVYDEKGKFRLEDVKSDEAMLKPCKIIGKKILKGKKVQLNLYDGKNILVGKDTYKVNDTVILDLKNKSIKKHLKLDKGSTIFLTGGRHIGISGTVSEILNTYPDPTIIFKSDKETFETSRNHVFVVEGKK